LYELQKNSRRQQRVGTEIHYIESALKGKTLDTIYCSLKICGFLRIGLPLSQTKGKRFASAVRALVWKYKYDKLKESLLNWIL